jgi:hypothetical protein
MNLLMVFVFSGTQLECFYRGVPAIPPKQFEYHK